jgi:hypothetical protein
MSLKSDYITDLRKTPDGIAEFLEVGWPAFVPTALPATVDAAQIVQGILAHNLNTALALYEGLYVVELLLRIGQHSAPIEAMCLAGLEYLSESNAQQEFEIKEPVDGQTYTQGDLRIVVAAKSSQIAQVAVTVACEVGSEYTVALQSDDGATWYGYARCDQVLGYTFAFRVTFNDDAKTVKTASLGITIAAAGTPEGDAAQNPEGEDLDAFNTSFDQLDTAYQAAINATAALDEGEVEDAWLDPMIVLGLGGAVKNLSKLGIMLAGEAAQSICQALVAEYEKL